MRSIWVGATLLLVGCSSSDNSGGSSNGDECRLNVQLSGGLDAKLGDSSQACVYSARSVGFAPLDGKVLVAMFVRKIEAGQTGTFAAEMTVDAGQDRWARAVCSVDVASNVPAPPTYDAGMSFNPHLLKGKGSCSTPAVFQGDGGTKAPVDIGPFTFTFTTLFY
ncbi:hypothetical protein LVJ94_50820 [Pendulispora rubella]|uniref:Lipoprotein n=1 Tax=Pendulispora rubella TaxID=2741070 RepID=A0ABZ2L2U8_9BACT